MHAQRFRNTSIINNYSRLILNTFLNNINYNNVHSLPCNNDAQLLANRSRRHGRRVQILTGKNLMKRNVVREAHRLNIFNRHLINLAADTIWNLRLTPFQRGRFIILATSANIINQFPISQTRLIQHNPNTIDQINTHRDTNDLEQSIFNGTDFNDDDSFDSLILPAGSFFGSSNFP
ncbi:18582_t:CDS:1 [Funneliformis geosporum]|uniref:5085_t:CDS:1 n=1 Tax=Funneliformis geosporum TaxID=1117311 RepID=A0A9W4SW30_9GLOM|nr:18582_t:CDS:1 [Funneliformis geosporum]CAI2183593.1 5085_t:CDS:1 [Funneliformis geosporum]